MTGRRAAPFHWATGMAMGVLAWILLMIGHEVVGHGSGCVAAGGEGLYFDAMYFECSEITDSVANRFYIAAGSVFNVLLGGAAVLLLRRSVPPARWFAYFLWITAAFNFLQGGSYIAFGRFIQPGMDWARIWNDTASRGRWDAITTVVGVGIVAAGVWVVRHFEPLFLAKEDRGWRKAQLLLMPWVGAAIVSVAAAALVPSEDRAMMIWGGIGNSIFFMWPLALLAWLPVALDRRTGAVGLLSSRPALIFAVTVVALFYVFWVGPGFSLD